MLLDGRERGGGEAAHRALELVGVLREEHARDDEHVVAAIAERREPEVHHVQAVVEVFAEAARADLFFEVPVRRGDDADVDLLGLRVADAEDDALLQRAEELHLQVQRELADLVEEERALVGLLELAGLVDDGARERAAHVTEQLALDEVLGDGAAVDRHERPVLALAPAVELLRDELLAGARLARDEDADVGAGDLLELAEHLEHRRARADDLAELLVVELGDELGLVGAERVQEHRVLQDERRLRREDREELELRALEEVLHLVVADVERADDLALRQERRAHDARELHRDDALALAEVRVGERVGDDDRARGLDDLTDDAVGDAPFGGRQRFFSDVARGAHAEAPLGRSLFAPIGSGDGLGAVDEEQEALVGVRELDDVVEHRLEELVDAAAVDELLAEGEELAHAGELARKTFAGGSGGRSTVVGALGIALRVRRRTAFGEHREAELDRAEGDAIAVNEPRAALLLAVDRDLGVAVRLLQDEVAAVEEDLRVVLRDAGARDDHVVAERFADGGERLVDAVEARGARGGEMLQRRHRRRA